MPYKLQQLPRSQPCPHAPGKTCVTGVRGRLWVVGQPPRDTSESGRLGTEAYGTPTPTVKLPWDQPVAGGTCLVFVLPPQPVSAGDRGEPAPRAHALLRADPLAPESGT